MDNWTNAYIDGQLNRTAVVQRVGGMPYDLFNRPLAFSLGTSTSGHIWTQYVDNWIVNVDHAQATATAAMRGVTVDAGTPNVQASIKIDTPTAPIDVGLYLRATDNLNGIFAEVTWTGALYVARVFEQVAGVFTGLCPLITPLPILPPPAPFILRVFLVGSAGKWFIDDGRGEQDLGTFSGATILTPTKHGLASNGSNGNNQFKNFQLLAAA